MEVINEMIFQSSTNDIKNPEKFLPSIRYMLFKFPLQIFDLVIEWIVGGSQLFKLHTFWIYCFFQLISQWV